MPRLALFLMGPPRVERDGLTVQLDRRKALALVAFLAVSAQSHRRDSLVNLLWPDYDSTRGRAALRRTLHALSAALGPGSLDADRDEIALLPSGNLWVDVAHFHQLLAASAAHGHPSSRVCPECVPLLAEAISLVRGDFLSGFGLKDSLNFDHWQLSQAESLRRQLLDAPERLVHFHSAQREFEPALAYARRRLALDNLDEHAHRQLMRLYAWSGRHSSALRQFEDCVSLLKEQLGVPPEDATCRLHLDIQAGHPPPLPTTLELPSAPPSFLQPGRRPERTVFVARESELERLDHFLQLALDGRGCVVFVTGEAGSGKTSLIQEFTRRALEAHGNPDDAPPRRLAGMKEPLVVALGSCNAYTGLGAPYLPFREILALLTGDVEARRAAGAMTQEHAQRLWHTLPLAARALAEVGPALVDVFVSRAALLERVAACALGEPGWLAQLKQPAERRQAGSEAGPQQTGLFDQYNRVLQALARQVPLVVVVDDLEWADQGSISLLFHLGRSVPGHRILLVGAHRPEYVAVDRAGERHPLEAVVNELQRSYGECRVDLDLAEGQRFVEAFLDAEPNRLGSGFREMLYRQPRGHPLFIVELLRGLQERGDLVQDREGRWVAGSALNWEALPARAEAAILEVVVKRILTPEFVQTVAARMNEALTQSVRDAFEQQVRQTEHQLAEVEKGISSLLDLAERYGSASAGQRLIEREAERAGLQAELRRLEFQRKNQEIIVTPELIESLLAPMHETLAGNDVRAKRQVLSKVLLRVEMGRKEGTLTYTFPLYDATGIYAVPPRGDSLKPHQSRETVDQRPLFWLHFYPDHDRAQQRPHIVQRPLCQDFPGILAVVLSHGKRDLCFCPVQPFPYIRQPHPQFRALLLPFGQTLPQAGAVAAPLGGVH